GLHPSYYTLAIILALLSFALGVAYTPWMASFTETVEDHNPALTATGLAIWGWIIRIVVAASFLVIPHVVTAVTPLVQYGPQAQAYQAQYPGLTSALAFAQENPQIVAVLTKNKALFTQLSTYSDPATIPPALIHQAEVAAGGGTSPADIAKGGN